MKNQIFFKKAVLAKILFSMSAFALLITSCKKDASLDSKDQTAVRAANTELIAYKNSDHLLSAGYYAVTGANILKVPDSVDIVDLWGIGIEQDNGASLPYIKQLQTDKGTAVIQCYWPPNEDMTADGYDTWAKNSYDKLITEEGLDGIDLDMESQLLSSMSDANKIVFMTAIVKYFGKNATLTVPRTGKKPILVFGTDKSIGSALLDQFKADIDYVFFQSYACPPNRWYGSLTDLANDMAVYNAGDNRKFFPMASAEGDYAWNINDYIKGTQAQILEFAKWAKEKNAGGTGVYHQEFDANHTPPYTFTNQSIQIMNPAKN